MPSYKVELGRGARVHGYEDVPGGIQVHQLIPRGDERQNGTVGGILKLEKAPCFPRRRTVDT